MTTPRQAIAKLVELRDEYQPTVDRLFHATPETVAAALADEKLRGPQIWEYGAIAFGPVKGGDLKFIGPASDEEICALKTILLFAASPRRRP